MTVSESRLASIPYFGGKQKTKLFEVIPRLLEYSHTYCEPFCGAASILLNRPCSSREIINDIDGNVVNFFRMLRERGPELIEKCQLTPFAYDEFERCRERMAQGIEDPIERARAWYVLTAQSRAGEYAHRWKSVAKSEAQFANRVDEAFPVIVNRLRRVSISNKDAVDLIEQIDGSEVTLYIDPPYPQSTRCSTRNYAHDSSDDLHERLLAAVTAPDFASQCVISSYPNEQYDTALSAWHRYEIDVQAHSSTEYDARRIEALYVNRLPARAAELFT